MKKERVLKCLPIVAMALIILFFGAALRSVSIEDILSLAPQSYVASALLLLVLYAVKSLSVVFPLLVLYVSAGVLFPTPMAILVNVGGLVICVSLPYLVGRYSGKDAVGKLTEKYPKAARLTEYSSENAVFMSYFLRVINLLPGDLVSMVLGASNLPFPSYLVGSLLGLLPVMIPAVLVGRNIQKPLSPQFLLPFVLMLAISLCSTFLYHRWQKKKKQKTE